MFSPVGAILTALIELVVRFVERHIEEVTGERCVKGVPECLAGTSQVGQSNFEEYIMTLITRYASETKFGSEWKSRCKL